MAEIGIIASVIGVAGAGFRLSLILNAVGSEVASAGIEIHSISKGVTLFSLMLKQVGQHLQTPDSVHSSEALATAKQITEECQHVFDEISEMLDRVQKKPDGSGTLSLQQRFKWCFKKHRVTYLLAQLESLKMSLLVMLQILQLGKLMASPTKSDSKEDVNTKEDVISTERAETQNIIIVRYWAISRLDRLFHAAEQEDLEERRAEIEEKNQGLVASGQPQLMLEAPPDSPISTALMRLPVVSLGELDQALNGIKESPRDMIRVSDSVIDPLLDRWTRWHEIKEQREHQPESHESRQDSVPRYTPSVDDLYEDEHDHLRGFYQEPESHETVRDQGRYLEGTTTDWRQPHSAEARREAARLRKQYQGFQPSVEHSIDTEVEDHHSVKPPFKAKPPSRHVIDSSSSSSLSSSDSEIEKPRQRRRRRRSSASLSGKSHTSDKQKSYRDSANLTRYGSSPATTGSTPRSSIGSPYSPHPQRPQVWHSASSPLPPLHTGNVPNPYQPPPPGAIMNPYAPTHGGGQYVPPRYVPTGASRLPPPRPPSSDGKHRSRERISPMTPHHLTEEEERRQARQRQQKNLRKGATRGLLGAGAIAGFLEALEGLSI